jgi:hypothetical protein
MISYDAKADEREERTQLVSILQRLGENLSRMEKGRHDVHDAT